MASSSSIRAAPCCKIQIQNVIYQYKKFTKFITNRFWTLQPKASAPNFSTLDRLGISSIEYTMDSSTRSFTTPDLSTIQYEYFQKQLKQIRDYIDFGTLENFDLLQEINHNF